MEKYEGVFIVRPDLNAENLKGLIGSVEDEIKKGKGSVDKLESWGKKNMAYSIKKFPEGVYYKVDFNIAPDALQDMERKFRLNENILRFMIIKKDKK